MSKKQFKTSAQGNALGSMMMKKVEATLIKEAADYLVVITRREYATSFEKNLDHDIKEDIRSKQEAGELWIDPTPQIAITFGSTEGKGVITHRFNARGYLCKDDQGVTDKLLEKDDIMVIGKYVCKESDNNLYERIEAPEKTEKALNILFGFMNKLGFTNTEQSIEDALKIAIDSKIPIVATVKQEEYEGKNRMVISKFTRPTLEDVTTVDEEAIQKEDFEN